MSPVGVIEDALEKIGIPASGDVITSSMAAASVMETGQKAAVVGGDGIREALLARGVAIVELGQPADAVIVGLSYDLSYGLLDSAFATLQQGARLIATNADPTYPDSHGLHPGAGVMVAALERCSGQTALVTGKPNGPQADLVRQRVSHADGRGVSGGVADMMVGDNTESDGLFADHLGYPFGHVLTGVEKSASPKASYVAPSLIVLAQRHG